jgi:hypothetical protein
VDEASLASPSTKDFSISDDDDVVVISSKAIPATAARASGSGTFYLCHVKSGLYVKPEGTRPEKGAAPLYASIVVSLAHRSPTLPPPLPQDLVLPSKMDPLPQMAYLGQPFTFIRKLKFKYINSAFQNEGGRSARARDECDDGGFASKEGQGLGGGRGRNHICIPIFIDNSRPPLGSSSEWRAAYPLSSAGVSAGVCRQIHSRCCWMPLASSFRAICSSEDGKGKRR